MAVKERKQITGTTAQIQAYKGHEGQIVWDKEKKTFVGMSGTAGKNYPLAPQAYVDNEVSKVNAQVTEGLAGKEDKGVCLPLSGGTLTGTISSSTGFFVEKDNDTGALLLDGGTRGNGARLTLYGKDHPANLGWVVLTARDATHTTSLVEKPDGSLKLAGKPVMRVFQYANLNVQLDDRTGVDKTVTLSSPFKSTDDYTLLVYWASGRGYATMEYCLKTKTTTNFTLGFYQLGTATSDNISVFVYVLGAY